MTSYRYLGYGTTDSNGVAHYTYSGTGAGEVDVIASLDNPISEGSIVSRTLPVLDGYWYDDGVTSPKAVTWWKPSSDFSESVDGTGTTITNNTTSTNHYWAKNYAQIDIGTFAIEFDLLSYTDNSNPRFMFSGTGGDNWIFKTELNAPQECHVKFIVDGEKIRYQIDGGTVTDLATTTNTVFYVGFRLNGEGSIKFKNFVIYPI